MNVIFLDFDGVIDTVHFTTNDEIESKIKILSEIVKEYDCKVVIEAACKDAINEDTLEFDSEWIAFVFSLFKKYNIECIGRTPNVERRFSDVSSLSMWKEDEIILYLLRHPEIEHFCVIDDDDLYEYSRHRMSDLNKLRDYLVKTLYFSENPFEEGLLPKHKEEVGKVLKKENKYQKYAKKIKKNL